MPSMGGGPSFTFFRYYWCIPLVSTPALLPFPSLNLAKFGKVVLRRLRFFLAGQTVKAMSTVDEAIQI